MATSLPRCLFAAVAFSFIDPKFALRFAIFLVVFVSETALSFSGEGLRDVYPTLSVRLKARHDIRKVC